VVIGHGARTGVWIYQGRCKIRTSGGVNRGEWYARAHMLTCLFCSRVSWLATELWLGRHVNESYLPEAFFFFRPQDALTVIEKNWSSCQPTVADHPVLS
jgi:hypothetical protein